MIVILYSQVIKKKKKSIKVIYHNLLYLKNIEDNKKGLKIEVNILLHLR